VIDTEIINNRYRIIECIKQNRVVSSYVVNDIIKNYATVQLNILNSEYIKKELIEFYTNEFISLTNLECRNITSVYQFALVNLTDNKKLNDKVYFYTNEYIKNNSSILNIVSVMGRDDLLDLFIEICQSINYLHLKGFVYGDINLTNIIVSNTLDNKKHCVKFKDFATVRLEKQGLLGDENNQNYFKAPEILAGEECSVLSDIYSLGILLFMIYIQSKDYSFTFGEEIKDDNESKLQEVFNKIKDFDKTKNFSNIEGFDINFRNIIEKMIYSDRMERYQNISELVMDINIFFHKKYEPHRKEEIEKLNFNLKMIGREEETYKLINIYKSIKYKSNSTILIHGESGIGKTRFLKSLKYFFSLNKVNVYNSFMLDAANKNSDKAFVDILKQFISECEPEVLERYESELIKFIPELGVKKNIIHSEPLSGDKEKFRLVHSTMGFIEECINNIPVVIIIDNFHLADDFTIELTEYLIRKKLPNKNIMIIMSYCDGECVLNKKFTEFIETISQSNNVINMFLKELSKMEIGKMIQDILSMPDIPYRLTDSIYEKTKGNPLFVQEVMKSLFNKKYIYVDKEKGYWVKDYEYSNFIIPTDMHQVLLNQVKEMGKLNYNILKIISIFESAVSLEIMKVFIGENNEHLEMDIKGLISSGILCEKIEDRGFVFTFYNKFLKSLMYEKIIDKDKKNMHKVASVLLEELYQKGGSEYIEELIYHLEKSNQNQKIVNYCIKNAEKMKLLKNRSDAIKNLTKALSIMDYSWDPVKNIKIIMDLAFLHEEEGNIELGVSYYLSIQKYNDNTELHKYIIDSLIKVIEVDLSKNNIDKAVCDIEKVKIMLEKVDYLSGWLKCQGVLASIYDIRQEYKKVQIISNSCIKMCSKENEEIKIIFYNHKGLACFKMGRTLEALVNFKKSIVLCNKYNNTKMLIKSLNNIGIIYRDFYQNDNKAIEYFMEMKNICEKNNMSSSEVEALISIGATYFSMDQYEISLQFLIESLEKCKKYEYECHIFYCYNSIASVYLKLGDYDNAYKYYELCNKELENYPNQGKNIGEFYILASKINYKLGNLQNAKIYIDKASNLYEYDESIFKWRVGVLSEYIKIHLGQDGNKLNESIKSIIITASKISSMSSRLDIFYELIIYLYENEKQEYVYVILSEINKINFDVKGHRVYAKKLYVDGLMEKNKSIKFFNEALEYSKKCKEIDIYWKAYTAIGDCFFDRKDYLHAVIYYFEACSILKGINLKLPIEYRLSYIKLSNALKPFNKFLCINNYYKSNKDIYMLKCEPRNIESEEELLYLLEQVNHKYILKNRNFIKSIKKIYSSSLDENIHNISDVLENLKSDNTKNLELIIDYLAYITLATRVTIIMSDNNKEYKVIASSDKLYKLPQDGERLSEILSGERSVLVTDATKGQDINWDINSIYNSLKASISIPIIMETSYENGFIKNGRRKHIKNSEHVIGYVYIESQRALNNVNNESMKKCIELSKVIGIIIEKYKLKLSASIDKLTGTLTRKYLEEALNEQVEVASQTGSKFSLIMYDLDHFKMINDNFGHRTGDYVLKRVCDIVMSNLRETDIVGRYGGEEFIIILPDTDICDAELVAEKLRNKIEEGKILDNRRDVTASMGIIACPLHGEWQGELVDRVDQALYVAKQEGRNRCVIWNSEFSKKAKKTDRLAGIISGNEIQNHRKVLAMIELIELININKTIEEKIYSILGRIIEVTEAQKGILFTVDKENVICKYSREIFQNEWIDSNMYNKNIIKSVIDSKQGVCKIDWDTITEYDAITGVPKWQSVIAIPLIKDDLVKGILYLTESTQAKEFCFDDFNFVNTLGKIIVQIL